MDFTQRTFNQFLVALREKNYAFLSLCEFIQSFNHSSILPTCILRHDVDRMPLNSLNTAKLEHSHRITGTYYFRIVPESFNEKIIQQIAELGHEIGYHYEDADLVYGKWRMENGKWRKKIREEQLIDLAYESFCRNLSKFRELCDIKTICMHGSPLSPFDNKAIWKKYNYKDLGIIGEPYLDIDWNEWAYFTDTGRRWDARDASIRDKVEGKFKFKFKSTQDIINNIDKLPDKIMFTIHPQRWNDKPIPWVKELVGQNVKNIIKRYVVKGNHGSKNDWKPEVISEH